MVEHARFSPWQFNKADFQMGHLLELALPSSQTTDKASCESDSYNHRTRIEGSFEGPMNPEHHASTPKLMRDIESMVRAKLNKVGPSKNGAKQKAFVTILAWSIF